MFNGGAVNIVVNNGGVGTSVNRHDPGLFVGIFVDRSDLDRPWFSVPSAGRYDITFIPGQVIAVSETRLPSGIVPGTGGTRSVSQLTAGLWRVTQNPTSSTPLLSPIRSTK